MEGAQDDLRDAGVPGSVNYVSTRSLSGTLVLICACDAMCLCVTASNDMSVRRPARASTDVWVCFYADLPSCVIVLTCGYGATRRVHQLRLHPWHPGALQLRAGTTPSYPPYHA